MSVRTAALLLVLAGRAGAAAAGEVPPPRSVLGFEVGEDRKLADWTQMVAYFKALDAASDRVRVDVVGQTTEGLPFLVVTLSSEANMGRLEEIRQANLRLADPRGLREGEEDLLLQQGRTVVALNHGIHSTEVGSTQTALETAYWLASAEDPATREVLDQTVVLMIPSQNPDGTQKVTEWYRKTLGTPYEGGAIPFLYQKYVGHDNNRDWYMFTQAETQLTVRHLYDRWPPQIVHDLHQMGAREARMFVPPYVDPFEPNVDPALVAAINALGSHMAARLTAEGKTGVAIHALYDAWAPSRAYPHTHGGVRILSEAASARMASPLEVPFDALEEGLGYDPKQASWNFPAPWPGGTWRLRDVVDYQLSATRALLEHAARHRAYWLRNFLEVSRRATRRRPPYAFVLPAEQKDPLATAQLLWVLRTGGVEVHRTMEPFSAGGRRFPAGSSVVLMAQPYSGFAKSLLERQRYPDLRQYKGGPPQRPLDVTAHTLPLLMGVEAVSVESSFPAELELEPVGEARVRPGMVDRGRGRFLAFGHQNGDLVALGRLLRAGVPVRWATEAFVDRGRSFPAGTLLAPAQARGRLESLARELGLGVRVVAASPRALLLRKPRVGVYGSWLAPMDEGWTRFVFERQAGVDYQTLRDKEVRAGGLRARYDVIVLPDQTPHQVVEGHPEGTLPREYVGGIGVEGVGQLKAFVQEGGTLVALDSACLLPLAAFGLPVRNALEPSRPPPGGEAPEQGVFSPGSILKTVVEGTSPLAHGLEKVTPVWYEQSPAFEAAAGQVVLRYPRENPLLSGWLLGDQHLHGKAALVEAPLGQGRVVLFGFRPQYRGQSWATYIALLNAIYTSAAAPASS